MIYHVKGDLLKSPCNIIAHQSNCHMAFGGGIASQIRSKLPGAYEAFIKDKRSPEAKFGTFSYADNNIGLFYRVYNLYGQFNYGCDKQHTDYTALENSIDGMLAHLESTEVYFYDLEIGLPYMIGCGLAGGDWNVVYNIIERVFEKYNKDVHLYEFTPCK